MSILNVWLERDLALVGVDTEAMSHTGGMVQGSKMLPVPHLNAVLAGRGTSVLLVSVFAQLVIRDCGGFDDLADRLPSMVEKAFKGTIGGFPLRYIHRAAYLRGHEIVLVGYSPKQKRMRAVEVVRQAGAKAFTVEETEREYVTPWHESIASAPSPANLGAIAKLAMAQVNLIKRTYPAAPAGGRLLVAEIFETRMVVRTVCELVPGAHLVSARSLTS